MSAPTRTATVVDCPLTLCPSASRNVGRIEQCPDTQSGRDWLGVSVHQDGHVQRCDGPYRAAQHVLTVHVLAAHGAVRSDMGAWATVAEAAHAVKRSALGRPPVVQPTVAECWLCQQRITRTPRGTWVDAWDSDVCEGTVTLCDNLCVQSHSAGSMPGDKCWHCGNGGLVYGSHEPITGPMSRHQS